LREAFATEARRHREKALDLRTGMIRIGAIAPGLEARASRLEYNVDA